MGSQVKSSSSRIYELQTPAIEDQIWSDAGLNNAKFFASLYFLKGVTHEPSFNRPCEHVNSDDTFLDRLALLYAHKKKSYTAQNVAATSLVKDKNGDLWTIYVAKNCWSHSRSQISDEDQIFGKELEDILNEESEELRDFDFTKIVTFWKDRVDFYVEELKRLWNDCKDAETHIADHLQKDKRTFDPEKFSKDWKLMEKKMEQLREASPGASRVSAASTFFKTFYSFWVDSRMFQLESYSISPNEGEFEIPKSVKSFRKSLKYMQMLGMPWSIWKSIKDFWERKGGIKVEIVFVETSVCAKDACKETELVQTLEEWKNRPITKSNAIRTLKTAPWDSRSNPYFHCELQLYLLSFEIRKRQGYEMHQFIGCSKLSCYACWKVLEATEYRTRAAHHKVYPDCVFPFPRPKDRETEGYKEIVQIFKDLQSLMTNDIGLYGRRRSTRAIEQTQPAYTDPSCNFDPGVAREQLQLMKARNFANKGFPYEIIESEGKFVGTYGRVFAAKVTHDTSKRKPLGSVPSAYYAVKKIRMRSNNHFRRVCTEVAILRELNHDNILKYVETLYDDQKLGFIYLVTRPWAPITLEHLLKATRKDIRWYNPESLDPWPNIVKGCLEGLNYLHARDKNRKEIKHKDLKPSNIILQEVPHRHGPFGEEGAKFYVRPIIADFGLSKAFVPNGQTDNMGTTPFKAPEQGIGDRGNSLSLLESDIWSLGCCFALILLLVYSGPLAFEKLWWATVEEGQPFEPNLELLWELIKDTYDAPESTSLKGKSREIFRGGLHQLVFDMLRVEPIARITPQRALKTMEEVEAHIHVIRLRLPPIYLWIDKHFSEPIDMNDPPTWPELLNRSHEFFVQNQTLPQRWLHSLFRLVRLEKQYYFQFRFVLNSPPETEEGTKPILRADYSSLPCQGWVSSAIAYELLQKRCEEYGHPSSLSLYLLRYHSTVMVRCYSLLFSIIYSYIWVNGFIEIWNSDMMGRYKKMVQLFVSEFVPFLQVIVATWIVFKSCPLETWDLPLFYPPGGSMLQRRVHVDSTIGVVW